MVDQVVSIRSHGVKASIVSTSKGIPDIRKVLGPNLRLVYVVTEGYNSCEDVEEFWWIGSQLGNKCFPRKFSQFGDWIVAEAGIALSPTEHTTLSTDIFGESTKESLTKSVNVQQHVH